ncbi:acetyltransferase [Bacteroides faecium]|uniref:Acetyltransferase n=1 Tax=Bacteroides faecium TaxID=2715212 RepID=A0A6H0KUH3_9BACE|nr:acetyltransferase [Bacteroides faecium]QIU96097.1 acetyltransferase [Bacteroides faecium]
MYLYGASGHAKVIIDIIKAQGGGVEGVVDDDPDLKELRGIPVLHDVIGLSPFIISIGNCKIRKMIAERLNCEFATVIHPSAIISSTATIGEGTVVMQGAIIQTEVQIGKHCIINTKASIDHECVIGDYVHIAPGCTISGDVHVGEGTWIGVGTTIIQGIHVGKNCFIGAGSVIVKDIPDNCKAYGVPCKIVETIK